MLDMTALDEDRAAAELELPPLPLLVDIRDDSVQVVDVDAEELEVETITLCEEDGTGVDDGVPLRLAGLLALPLLADIDRVLIGTHDPGPLQEIGHVLGV